MIMMTLEMPVEMTGAAPAAPGTEPVLETLKLVARRADALARRQPFATRETDRRVWLRAELEIFDTVDRARPVHERCTQWKSG